MENKSCLLIIDMQKGIFKLKQPVYKEYDVIENIKKSVELARKNNIKVFFSQHENSTFLNRGSEDWEIISDIDLKKDDVIINKKHPSIFRETGLQDILSKEKITRLNIAGLISNGCVKDACLDALKNKFEVVLLKDCHSTFYKNAEKVVNKINDELEKEGVLLKSINELF